jgi:hypothetical protein
MPGPSSTHRRRFAALALATALLSACQDVTHPLEPKQPEPVAVAALDAGTAASLAVALDDALGRLLPAADRGGDTLREALVTLTTSLADVDVVTLDRNVADVRVALAGYALEPADADALSLALDAVARARTGTH